MSDKRRALGRGLGALIPTTPNVGPLAERPVDVLFRNRAGGPGGVSGGPDPVAAGVDHHHDAPSARQGLLGPSAHDVATTPAIPMAEGPRTDDLATVPGASFAELAVADIRPNPRQPRTVFDEDELEELASSIREIGVLQPVVVRRIPARRSDGSADDASDRDTGADPSQGTPRFELVMGERRLRASERAGLTTIPAIVKDTQDDALLRDALLENLHRSQLNPLEEAAAYQQLLEDFGCSHEELASRIGRSRPQISNTVRLLRLPPLVARRVAAGVLSAGHARALLALPDAAAMERLAQRVVAEGLSVRSVEEIVAIGDVGDVRGDGAIRDGSTGADEPHRAGRRRPDAAEGQVHTIAARVADRLDTRVAVSLSRRRGQVVKGKMTVEFAGLEDLERIAALMECTDTTV